MGAYVQAYHRALSGPKDLWHVCSDITMDTIAILAKVRMQEVKSEKLKSIFCLIPICIKGGRQRKGGHVYG